MNYTIKSHPTMYCGVLFRSRLEARWAAFFDLAGWSWEYEPIDLEGWTPDFRVTFQCGHSQCDGSHTLLVEVKPYFTLSDFNGHPCMEYPYGFRRVRMIQMNVIYTSTDCIPADASAAFGANPDVTHWEMIHGSGGGVEDISCRVDNYDDLWKRAGTMVQYHPAG
jgi:hypothetical protein